MSIWGSFGVASSDAHIPDLNVQWKSGQLHFQSKFLPICLLGDKDDPSIHLGDIHGILAYCLEPGPALTIEVNWENELVKRRLCVCVCVRVRMRSCSFVFQ